MTNQKSGCCSSGDGINLGNTKCCCSSGEDTAQESEKHTRIMEIDFMFIDLDTCTRCCTTDDNLDEALAQVSEVLKATGFKVVLRKILVESVEQARELAFVSSPTIRINGRDIQLDVKESLCESCGDICGDDVDCRIWTYQGQEYTAPPKAMIIEAVLSTVYGGEKNQIREKAPTGPYEVPENLKKFFAAKQRKANAKQ